jgi:hypothetical protein
MAGYNFWKRLVAVCKASTLCHSKRRPMPAHHNFTTQTTLQKCLIHGDNTIMYFFYCSSYQVNQKHWIPSSILWWRKPVFWSTQGKGLASLGAPWNACAVNHACGPPGYPLSQMVYHSRAAIIWWEWCQQCFAKRSGHQRARISRMHHWNVTLHPFFVKLII